MPQNTNTCHIQILKNWDRVHIEFIPPTRFWPAVPVKAQDAPSPQREWHFEGPSQGLIFHKLEYCDILKATHKVLFLNKRNIVTF